MTIRNHSVGRLRGALRWLWLGLFAVLMLAALDVSAQVACPGPVPAVLGGSQTIGAQADSDSAGTAEAFTFTSTSCGNAASISVYVDTGSTAPSMTVGLYADAGGHPGALISQGTLAAPKAASWNTIPIAPVALAGATPYWVAVLGTTSGILRFRDTKAGCRSESSSQKTLTQLPATWTTGTLYTDCPLSAYVNSGSGVAAVTVTALSVVPASVTGGAGATGTVTLSGAAAAATVVSLTSSSAAAVVPASVTVAAGQTSANFAVTTGVVAASTAATLTATANATSKTAVLTVVPVAASPTLSNVAVAPASVTGGAGATGTVTFTGAVTAATAVTLSSSSAAAVVPASVSVTAGQTSATFTIATTAVSSATTATITATQGGVSQTDTLSIVPSTGGGCTGTTVAAGTNVIQTGADSNAAGAAEAFAVTATGCGTTASVSVYVDTGSAATTLVVGLYADAGGHPGALLAQGSLAAPKAAAWNTVPVSAATLTQGNAYWIAVLGRAGILRFRDRAGGTCKAESFSGTGLTAMPGTWATGTVYTDCPLSAYVTTTAGGGGGGATLSTLSVAPAAVTGGAAATGTVTLTAVAAAATVVTLSDNSTAATVPASVTVAAGQSSATFPISTTSVAASTAVTITASLAGATSTATLTVQAAAQTPTLTSLSLSPSTVTGGTGATGTVTLSAAATGATSVTLTDGSALSGVPASVTVNAGQVSASFPITTSAVSATTSVTISATLAGVTQSAVLTLLPATGNAIQIENQKPGTANWQMTNPVTSTSPEIVGYASATSVNQGGSLNFMISVAPAGQYTINVYRMGYYGGVGARRVLSSGTLSGTTQSACGVTDSSTLLIECRWNTSYTITTGADWTTGLYVANLTASASGKQSQIWFAVRDDSSHADILYQASFNTYLAYNNFGTSQQRSLYGFNSTGGVAAFKVSLDRPFGQASTDLARYDKLTSYEYNMVRWLESQGYDVAYSTDLDVDLAPALIKQHRMLMTAGHSEYWTMSQRDAIENARNTGTHLAFFAANTAYWRVRYEPSSTGVPNRVMVCYKCLSGTSCTPDPVEPTTLFRDPAVNRPENALMGVMYVGDDSYNEYGGYNFIVQNAGDLYYRNTGVTNGQSLGALVGYEWDAVGNNGSTPAGTVILGSSTPIATNVGPQNPPGSSANSSHAVRYTHPSGAKVFSTGSIQWLWGLDSDGVQAPRESTAVKQMFVNILADMGVRPANPDPGLIVP